MKKTRTNRKDATMTTEQRIGGRIRKLREEMGLTSVELAERVGITQAQVSRLENGKQGFRSKTLEQIAKSLNVPMVRLLTDGDDAALSLLKCRVGLAGAVSNPKVADAAVRLNDLRVHDKSMFNALSALIERVASKV
jgi:transcriptional regulator with XRE-family HTH domain